MRDKIMDLCLVWGMIICVLDFMLLLLHGITGFTYVILWDVIIGLLIIAALVPCIMLITFTIEIIQTIGGDND